MDNRSINSLPDILTKKQLARALGCSAKTIDRKVKIGLIKQYDVCGLIRFKREEFPILNKTA